MAVSECECLTPARAILESLWIAWAICTHSGRNRRLRSLPALWAAPAPPRGCGGICRPYDSSKCTTAANAGWKSFRSGQCEYCTNTGKLHIPSVVFHARRAWNGFFSAVPALGNTMLDVAPGPENRSDPPLFYSTGSETPSEEGNLRTTTFGATGRTFPRLCLGTGEFGRQGRQTVAPRESWIRPLRPAASTLLRFRPTSPTPWEPEVGPQRGDRLGGALCRASAPDPPRHQTGGPWARPLQQGGSRKHLLDAIRRPLRRLGTASRLSNSTSTPRYTSRRNAGDPRLDCHQPPEAPGKPATSACRTSSLPAGPAAAGRTEDAATAPVARRSPTALQLLFRQDRRELLPLARYGHGGDSVQPRSQRVYSRQYSVTTIDRGGFSAKSVSTIAPPINDAYYWHNQLRHHRAV